MHSFRKRPSTGQDNEQLQKKHQPSRTRTSDSDSDSDEDQDSIPDSLPSSQSTGDRKRGSIVRVKLHNFVTYDDVEFYPGPLLNLVIGPNGSGKSSIVCAFCLALAGQTKILGRAKELKDYIKTGAEKGFVELELYQDPPKRNIVVRREMNIDNKSSWKLNGDTASEQTVKNVLQQLRMQIDNLCQFLPQDRVADFARLDPPSLLMETEKAVGSPKLLTLHKSLIELRSKQKEKSSSFDITARHLQDLKDKNKSLERDVERFRLRQTLMTEIDHHKKKRPWLIFEEQRVITLGLRQAYQEAKEKHEAEKKKHAPFFRQLSQAEADMKEIDKKISDNFDKLKAIDATRKKLWQKTEKLDQDTDQKQKELENLNEKERSIQTRITQIREKISRLKQQLNDLPDIQDLQDSLKTLNREEEEASQKRKGLRTEKIAIDANKRDHSRQLRQAQERLADLNNLRKQRIQSLRKDHAVFAAYEWIQQNPNLFRKPILGPILLEINVSVDLHAQYLEQHLPAWLRIAFIPQTDEDTKKLLAWMKDTGNRVGYVFNEVKPNYSRPCDLRQPREWGFEGWLDELFEAPTIVKDVLIFQARINEVACGNERSRQNTQQMLEFSQKNRIGIFFTPEARYQSKRSKYGSRNLSTIVIPLRPAKSFTGIDLEQKRRLEEDVGFHQQKLSEKENQINLQDAELAKVFTQKAQLNEKIRDIARKRKQLEDNIAYHEGEEAELQRTDLQREEQHLRKALQNLSKERLQNIAQITTAFGGLTTLSLEHDSLAMRGVAKRFHYNQLQIEQRQINQRVNDLKEDEEMAEQRFNDAKQRAKILRSEAEKNSPLTDEMKVIFQNIPSTIQELDDKINELEATLSGNLADDPQVLEQYEHRKAQIEKLEEKLTAEEQNVETQKNQIEQQKKEWLPELKQIVERINESFGEHFKAIGCVGEVRLDQFEDDFDRYAISIWVKFRESESLQRLTAHHQSGGERSVSTMLYLISLQDLTPAPFRLVDEINQGMDPNNERMIFKLVSSKTCRPGSSQYFLITPKLLTDLEYHPSISVLCVFNGPWMIPQNAWKPERYLTEASTSSQ